MGMLISKFVARLSVLRCPFSVSTIAVKNFKMNEKNDEKNPFKRITVMLSKSVKISV